MNAISKIFLVSLIIVQTMYAADDYTQKLLAATLPHRKLVLGMKCERDVAKIELRVAQIKLVEQSGGAGSLFTSEMLMSERLLRRQESFSITFEQYDIFEWERNLARAELAKVQAEIAVQFKAKLK